MTQQCADCSKTPARRYQVGHTSGATGRWTTFQIFLCQRCVNRYGEGDAMIVEVDDDAVHPIARASGKDGAR